MFANFKIVTLSLLAGTALAEHQWQVTEWTAGNKGAGYYYSFEIKGEEHSSMPAFTAQCSGAHIGGNFEKCEITDEYPGDRLVAAHLLPSESGALIEVSYQHSDEHGGLYNFIGEALTIYNNGVNPQSFPIYPKVGIFLHSMTLAPNGHEATCSTCNLERGERLAASRAARYRQEIGDLTR